MQLNHSIDFEIQPSKPQSPTKVPGTLAGPAPSYLAPSSWSLFPEVVNRPNSSPPFPFSFPNKVEKVTSFDCCLCSKTFSWKKRLDSHMAVHSDVRPYKCLTCLDSFKKSHHLRRHIKGCDKRLAKRKEFLNLFRLGP
jgi:uncharacterized Zn-finger protein